VAGVQALPLFKCVSRAPVRLCAPLVQAVPICAGTRYPDPGVLEPNTRHTGADCLRIPRRFRHAQDERRERLIDEACIAD